MSNTSWKFIDLQGSTIFLNSTNSSSSYTFTKAYVVLLELTASNPLSQNKTSANISIIDVSTTTPSTVIYSNNTFATLDDFQIVAKPNPVGLGQYGAMVEFSFSTQTFKTNGYNYTLTFWPGDSSNQSVGPFNLGMSYNVFKNMIPIFYNFQLEKTYNVIFNLSSENGVRYFEINVTVLSGMIQGFYVVCDPPAIQPSQSFQIKAYLLNGTNVTFKWWLGNNLLLTSPRNCNFLTLFSIDSKIKMKFSLLSFFL